MGGDANDFPYYQQTCHEEHVKDLHPLAKYADEICDNYDYGAVILLFVVGAGLTHYGKIMSSFWLRKLGAVDNERRGIK